MKILGYVTIMAILVSSAAGTANAQELETGSIVATAGAVDALSFDDGLKVDDLVFVFGEPAIRNRIPFAVLNAGDKAIDAPRFAITATGDEASLEDDSAWAFPTTVEPGAFGFGEAYFESGFADDDAEFDVTLLPAADNAGDIRILEITNASGSSTTERATGTILNSTDDDVENVEVHVLCIEESGIILEYGFDVLDRRLLKSGTDMEFETKLPEDCGSLWFMTSIALVKP